MQARAVLNLFLDPNWASSKVVSPGFDRELPTVHRRFVFTRPQRHSFRSLSRKWIICEKLPANFPDLGKVLKQTSCRPCNDALSCG